VALVGAERKAGDAVEDANASAQAAVATHLAVATAGTEENDRKLAVTEENTHIGAGAPHLSSKKEEKSACRMSWVCGRSIRRERV
jgi:hypothetical protein